MVYSFFLNNLRKLKKGRKPLRNYSMEAIRKQIIGNNLIFDTPFGKRHLLYADYTASGRGLRMIEEKIWNIEKSYANTHTKDDYSGNYLTNILQQAETKIKELINAGPHGKIIPIGSGATGALKKLQEIIGVYLPPATQDRITQSINAAGYPNRQTWEKILKNRPVVFIGPYEHHTNELMWREAFVEVVVVKLDKTGMIDLADFSNKIAAPKYNNRIKLASFSAGSNITGTRTQVYAIAQICHRHDAWVFFDFAAVAPYIKIDMNKDEEAYFDAIFFSPHKFLGGPGTSGILIFNEKIYRKDLPPTTAGGGTVTYVGLTAHDFSKDIESREKAGTPPILQTIKAALVMDLKEKIGIKAIENIENHYSALFLTGLKKIRNLELIGDVAPDKRISIVSFNIRHQDRVLHPKFVTKLMNDLFGIQSRAGCSCAGPYGHALLGINNETSLKYRRQVLKGLEGLKLGWVRVNIHYTLTREDVEYLMKTIDFIARSGHLFLHKYAFNMQTSEWQYIGFKEKKVEFSVLNSFESTKTALEDIPRLRKSYLEQAEEQAANLAKKKDPGFIRDDEEIEELKVFYYAHKARI